MIQLKNIQKTYKMGNAQFQALHSINLEVHNGEFLAIRGRSGAGKSTLLHVLGCLDSYDRGEYFFHNQNVGLLSEKQKATLRNHSIGFVLQDFALIHQKTVLYNVMLPLFFSSEPYSKMKKRALTALEQTGIMDQATKKVSQLSGGQRQRVAIARAIVNSPDILLADEPTGSLDTKTASQIMSLISELNQHGVTVIVVTHDDITAGYASRQIYLEDGYIVQHLNNAQ